MEVKVCKTGVLQENCYCIYDGNECVIVDPGDEAEIIINCFGLENKTITNIILTHAHFDHTGAVAALAEKYHARVCVHKDDAFMLENPSVNLSSFMSEVPQSVHADFLLTDGDKIPFSGSFIRVIHTPGHTPGGVCYVIENCLFSGDTLFRLSIGRTDFPYGDFAQLDNSVRNILGNLEGDYIVYPGHDSSTTLEFEKNNNPYMK